MRIISGLIAPLLARLALVTSLAGLWACSPPPQGSQTVSFTVLPSKTILATPSATIRPATATNNPPISTFTPLPFTATPTATLTATPPLEVCSPLQGITLDELPQIVTNPFDPPRPGLDDGHHGVDLAFYRHGDQIGMSGLPVLSVLTGIVAAAVKDRPPYGNMVIIETPLESVPPGWNAILQLPTLAPTVTPPNLTCPVQPAFANLDTGRRSLFLLYAHLNQPTTLKAGQAIACGNPLGAVGTTGNSVNPHLHLEVRVGPAGARFDGMAHYIGDATTLEMLNYCAWRVSGLFQMSDPMKLLSLRP
jgi:murein DD-endopeptidase MepM/ murein hydrolase activator NlpD